MVTEHALVLEQLGPDESSEVDLSSNGDVLVVTPVGARVMAAR